MDVFQFFAFDGRIGRGAFLGLSIIGFIFNVVGFAMLGYGELNTPVGFLGLVVFFLVVIMNLATSVKRWHDRGKSGWWMLLGLVPLIGGLWCLIEQGFLPGTEGYNQYGAPGSGSPFGDGALAAHQEPYTRMRA